MVLFTKVIANILFFSKVFSDLARAITRRKTIDKTTVEETKLNRVLTVVDLTALGIGSTLGKFI